MTGKQARTWTIYVLGTEFDSSPFGYPEIGQAFPVEVVERSALEAVEGAAHKHFGRIVDLEGAAFEAREKLDELARYYEERCAPSVSELARELRTVIDLLDEEPRAALAPSPGREGAGT